MCGIGERKHNRYGSLRRETQRKSKDVCRVSCVVCREDRARVLETCSRTPASQSPDPEKVNPPSIAKSRNGKKRPPKQIRHD